mgnify:CR=1 FL=1
MIRWITDFLGTAPASQVVLEDDMRLLDVRDLVDKFGNAPDEVRKKIDAGVALLKEGHRLVVACDYGISRSNSVAIGLLSVFESIPFDDAAYRVVQATGEQEIKLGPLNAVRAALNGKGRSVSQGARILVTGGTGFIGSYFLSQFEKELNIFAPTSNEIDLLSGSTLLDLYVKKNGITHIAHLANPRIYTSNRAMGDTLCILRNVLDVCVSNSVKLIFPSGWEIYTGNSENLIVADEKLKALPKGPYGETKWLCEMLINHYRAHNNLYCTILRSSPLYGVQSDKPKFIWNFIGKSKKGTDIFTHKYRNAFPALDLMHVSDFSAAIHKAVFESYNDNFNLGTGKVWQTNDIAEMICEFYSSNSKVKYHLIDDDLTNIAMNYSLAKEKLGWYPSIKFDDGLKEILATGGKHE